MHLSWFGRRFACAAALPLLQLLLMCTIPGHAGANMAAPARSGDPVTEPYPLSTSMHILHEDLSIDMREVRVGAQAVRIRARYQVRNDGPAQRIELFFVAPGLRSGQVRHRGQRIPAHANQLAAQQMKSAAALPGPVEHLDGLSFSIDFEPGEQTVEVNYEADAQQLPLDLVYSYAVDYVFAPARRWASFGTLNLELLVPAGWELVDLPEALEKAGEGNVYRARFNALPAVRPAHRELAADYHWHFRALPADTLRFHVAPPLAPHRAFAVIHIAGRVIAILLPVLAAWRLRRRSRRLGQSVRLSERLLSFALTALVVAVLPPATLSLEATWYPGAIHSYPTIFATLGTWIAGSILCVVGHAFFGRAARPQLPAQLAPSDG